MSIKDRLFYISLDNCRELSQFEKNIVLDISQDIWFQLMKYRMSRQINLMWCDKLKHRTINAVYVQYHMNYVFLSPVDNPIDILSDKLKSTMTKTQQYSYQEFYKEKLTKIVPYVIHELIHRMQRKHYGAIIYGMMCMPGLYYFLDKEAFWYEKEAARLLKLDVSLYGKTNYNNH